MNQFAIALTVLVVSAATAVRKYIFGTLQSIVTGAAGGAGVLIPEAAPFQRFSPIQSCPQGFKVRIILNCNVPLGI
jgi:hypothetical protein